MKRFDGFAASLGLANDVAHRAVRICAGVAVLRAVGEVCKEGVARSLRPAVLREAVEGGLVLVGGVLHTVQQDLRGAVVVFDDLDAACVAEVLHRGERIAVCKDDACGVVLAVDIVLCEEVVCLAVDIKRHGQTEVVDLRRFFGDAEVSRRQRVGRAAVFDRDGVRRVLLARLKALDRDGQLAVGKACALKVGLTLNLARAEQHAVCGIVLLAGIDHLARDGVLDGKFGAEHIPDELRGFAAGERLLVADAVDVIGQPQFLCREDVPVGVAHVRRLVAERANREDEHVLIGDRVVVAVDAVASAEDEFQPREVIDCRAVFGHIGEDGAFVCVPNLGVGTAGDCLNEEQSRLITGHALVKHEIAVLVALQNAERRQMMRRVGVIRAALCRAGRYNDRTRKHQHCQHEGKKFSQISHVCSPFLLRCGRCRVPWLYHSKGDARLQGLSASCQQSVRMHEFLKKFL